MARKLFQRRLYLPVCEDISDDEVEVVTTPEYETVKYEEEPNKLEKENEARQEVMMEWDRDSPGALEIDLGDQKDFKEKEDTFIADCEDNVPLDLTKVKEDNVSNNVDDEEDMPLDLSFKSNSPIIPFKPYLDTFKFQKFHIEKLLSPMSPDAPVNLAMEIKTEKEDDQREEAEYTEKSNSLYCNIKVEVKEEPATIIAEKAEELLSQWSDVSDAEEHTSVETIKEEIQKQKNSEDFINKTISDVIKLHIELNSTTPEKKENSPSPSSSSDKPSKEKRKAAKMDKQVNPTKKRKLDVEDTEQKQDVQRENIYKCLHCHRTYSKRTKLLLHMRHIHFDKGVAKVPSKKRNSDVRMCPECGKDHRTKTEMYMHRLVHFRGPGLKCQMCDERHRSYTSLQEHMKKDHMRWEAWFCPVCPGHRTFSQNNSLLLHIASQHHVVNSPEEGKIKNVPCHYCKHKFTSKSGLERHVKNIHGE